MTNPLFFPKELSWLSFNERVLQEAADETVPIIERLRFLGIFSSNMDEFFRVRVAEVRRRILLKKYQSEHDDPERLLHQIHEKVLKLNKKFNTIYNDCCKTLARHNIHIVSHDKVSHFHDSWLKQYFRDKVLRHISPIIVTDDVDLVECMDDQHAYLVVEMIKDEQKPEYAVIEVPTDDLPRFVQLPPEGSKKKKNIILLDDIICHFLSEVFSGFMVFDTISAYSLKMTRDAEYDLHHEIDQSLLDNMSRGLKQRVNSEPVRAVFDEDMPEHMIKLLKKKLHFSSLDSLQPAGRYRNFKDFLSFPNVGRAYLENPKLPSIESQAFSQFPTAFEAIQQQDILLYYPYHKFRHFTELVRQASFDPKVTSIYLNMYRVAKKSRIIGSLEDAVKNGKKVTVVVELRARFDEEANIEWAKTMTDAGIHVIFGIPSLKVHSKLCLIKRKEKGKVVRYAHIGTGNFHEKTAKLYTDFSLFTCHPEVTQEVDHVFNFIMNSYKRFDFKHLVVSPLNSRQRLLKMIGREMKHAKSGLPSEIIIKVNNLVDREIIAKLYQASHAGVRVRAIIRGMCSLVPGVKGLSENIEVISIVDRFLEHPRVCVFHNNGQHDVFISSADWMTRNIDHRVEVGVPIYDTNLKQQIINILEIQFKDTTKARIIDAEQKNRYKPRGNKRKIRSQVEIHRFIAQQENIK